MEMRVKINGQDMDVRDEITVRELLRELKIEDKTMAVAINLQVVKKEDWDSRKIKENDRVEFLTFVGGG